MKVNTQIKLSGIVLRGDGYGKKLGFPTANIDRRQYARSRAQIRLGIYGGTARLVNNNSKDNDNPKVFLAGIVVGPVDKQGLPKIEAHLIGFKGNLYGKKIELQLKKYLRVWKAEKNAAAVKKMIAQDITAIKKMHL